MARIIDKEGAEFGAAIERKSKVMQEINQLNPEQTSSLMTRVQRVPCTRIELGFFCPTRTLLGNF